MKAIILAAGGGVRLNKYTKDMPKGMLKLAGQSLIERQIDNFRSLGINDVIIITGYMAEKIDYEGVRYYHNPNYQTTNMVESLFCAEGEFDDELIVSYGDIIYEKRILQGLVNKAGHIVVTVDREWEKYWKIRYGMVSQDTESLRLTRDGAVEEIGREELRVDQIHARYVGLIKFSQEGVNCCKKIYHANKEKYWDKPWQVSGKSFQQAYMTDMIQALIDAGLRVDAYPINGGWLEFDTNQDYEKMASMLDEGSLSQLIDLNR